jgi:hypothetical protein
MTDSLHWALRLGIAGCTGVIAVLLLAMGWPRLRKEVRLVISYLPLPWRRTSQLGKSTV